MATSNFTLQLVEVIEEAFERASGGARRMREGYDFKTARRSINLLTMEWANRGINLWTMEQGTIPLETGVETYAMPPDTIDVIEFAIRTNPDEDNQQDIIVSRISMPDYMALTNKRQRGRPTRVLVRRDTTPAMTFWPVPDKDYLVAAWRMRRIQDAGKDGTATMDIPFRFIPAFISGLAFYLAQKMQEGSDRAVLLKQEYEAAFAIAASEDRERAPVQFVPGIARV